MVIQLTVFVIRPLVRMTICTRNFRITCKCLEKRIERTKHRWLASDNARVSLNPPHCDRELRVSASDRADHRSSGQACQVFCYGRSEDAMYRAYGVRQVPGCPLAARRMSNIHVKAVKARHPNLGRYRHSSPFGGQKYDEIVV